MSWTAPDVPIPDGPMVGPDRPILDAYLDWQRATLRNIVAGLDADQLARRPLATTQLSLLGLIRHLAKVERHWFRIQVAGQDVPPLYPPGSSEDFDDIDAAGASAALDRHAHEVALARDAVRDIPFDTVIDYRGDAMSLRMITLHMIGEYARHNGHADLLREAIDGVTGR